MLNKTFCSILRASVCLRYCGLVACWAISLQLFHFFCLTGILLRFGFLISQISQNAAHCSLLACDMLQTL